MGILYKQNMMFSGRSGAFKQVFRNAKNGFKGQNGQKQKQFTFERATGSGPFMNFSTDNQS